LGLYSGWIGAVVAIALGGAVMAHTRLRRKDDPEAIESRTKPFARRPVDDGGATP